MSSNLTVPTIFFFAGDCSLYARATKAGLTDSLVMQEDYWREREDNLPPGWQPL